MKKKVIIIITILVIVAVVGTTFYAKSKVKSTDTSNKTVISQAITKEVISSIDVEGVVRFKDEVSECSENNGKATKVLIKEGDIVQEGQVLVEYDTKELKDLKDQLTEAQLSLEQSKLSLNALKIPTDKSQLKQMEAGILTEEDGIRKIEDDLLDAKKDIEKATNDFESANILYEEGAISLKEKDTYEKALDKLNSAQKSLIANLGSSQKQLEASKLKLSTAKDKSRDDSLENNIESQKITVQQAQIRLDKIKDDINNFTTQTKASISGTILSVEIAEGEVSTKGKVIAKIGDSKKLIIEANIPEYDMKDIKLNQKVKVKSDNLDDELTGKIIKVYPTAQKPEGSTQSSTVKVEVGLDSVEGLISGYTADLTITTSINKDAIVIPATAYITQTNDYPYVFIVNEGNILEKRVIKIEGFDGALVSVEGVKIGEIVVSSPIDISLTEGSKIEPANEIGEGEELTEELKGQVGAVSEIVD